MVLVGCVSCAIPILGKIDALTAAVTEEETETEAQADKERPGPRSRRRKLRLLETADT